MASNASLDLNALFVSLGRPGMDAFFQSARREAQKRGVDPPKRAETDKIVRSSSTKQQFREPAYKGKTYAGGGKNERQMGDLHELVPRRKERNRGRPRCAHRCVGRL